MRGDHLAFGGFALQQPTEVYRCVVKHRALAAEYKAGPGSQLAKVRRNAFRA